LNYYNENDPKAVAWLRELVKAQLIPAGEIDDRSILDVKPSDLTAFTQCHFFAGIGGWAYALRLAGWPDTRPVWTASCPCQPFSCAGKQLAEADERHLWPVFRQLVAECKPATIFGEQVASKLGRVWLAGIRVDLEGLGYGVGAADLCAAGIGAPHIRQRLYWLADTGHEQAGWGARPSETESGRAFGESSRRSNISGLEYTESDGRGERRAESSGGSAVTRCSPSGMGHAERNGAERSGRKECEPNAASETCRLGRLEGQRRHGDNGHEPGRLDTQPNGPTAGASATCHAAWSDFDLIPCADGKTRRIESGLLALAHGIPGRVGLLRGYGNAIVPQLAAEFIKAYCEITGGTQ
jgi:DNA (cytosine-5)-methyltransferase 1